MVTVFAQHIQDHWPTFITDFGLYLTVAIITLSGAYWIFRRETERHFRIEKQTFKRSGLLPSEWVTVRG